MTLSREEILRAADLPTEDVDVPEWGGSVRVRALTAADRDRIEGEQADASGPARFHNFRARLVARAAVDGAGRPLFGEDDVHALAQKSAVALDRVFTAVLRMNGLTASAQ